MQKEKSRNEKAESVNGTFGFGYVDCYPLLVCFLNLAKKTICFHLKVFANQKKTQSPENQQRNCISKKFSAGLRYILLKSIYF